MVGKINNGIKRSQSRDAAKNAHCKGLEYIQKVDQEQIRKI